MSFRNVNGIYDRGKTKKNHIEAEAIVTELFNRLKEPIKQQESVGIVTFSQVQKVFIKPVPSEWKQYVRDFSSSESLVHSQIIQEDMKNNRIRSTLTDIGLEKELVKLYRNAKNTLEESGANSLFVALGFLKWFDDKSYTKERFSPIPTFLPFLIAPYQSRYY